MPDLVSDACLRAISALVEGGSFSAAARRLGLSHVTVAAHIHGFEDRNGILLFEREKGRLTPTPFCVELLEAAGQFQEAADDIDRLIQRRNPSGRRQIKVGLGNALPGMGILKELMSHHPDIMILIEGGTHQSIMRDLIRRELDVAILPDLPNDSRLRRLELVPQEVVALVNKDHPLAKEKVLDLTTLAQQNLIFRARGSSTQRIVDRAFAAEGLSPDPRLIVTPREAVYEAVKLNLGIGFIWRNSTTREEDVVRIPIGSGEQLRKEMIFALKDDNNPLINLIFLAAERYVKSSGFTVGS